MQEQAYNPPSSSLHWPSVIQFALSLVGILLLWGGAASTLALAFVQLFDPATPSTDDTSVFLIAAGTALSGVLLVPSAVLSLLRIMQKRQAAVNLSQKVSKWIPNPSWLIFIVPLAILIGSQIPKSATYAWLALPLFHLIAVGFPIWWVLHLGKAGLSHGSLQRAWGVFASGLLLGPTIILFAEVVALVVLGVVAIIYVSTQPDLVRELEALVRQVEGLQDSPEEVLRLLEPYLADPRFAIPALGFVAGIVPLIEEFFKPVGVWLLAGRRITPAEGFVAGLLSGAGFALFENLAYATMGENWAAAAINRLGTGVLHITTAGLIGWALALAWQRRRYFTLALTYLGMVAVHGIWNGIALVAGGLEVGSPSTLEASGLGGTLMIALVAIVLIMFLLMLLWNFSLKKAEPMRSVNEFNGSSYITD